MRICLVAHGFPPVEKAGVENFTAQLARGLARAGHAVSVFVPRVAEDLPDLSLRLERRGEVDVHWLSTNSPTADPEQALDPPGRAEQFAAFLDRERPDLVHFHHVLRLGLGVIEAAHARGIPTVYTAHDYYPVSESITLLRPDLMPTEALGDPEHDARRELAISLLNTCAELGDYHLGVLLAPGVEADSPFASPLPAELTARLRATLDGDRAGSGFPDEEWGAAVERAERIAARRAEAYAKLDLVIAPTKFLGERLVEGGMDAERITHLPYGIDTCRLVELPCASAHELAERPLRIGFNGSCTKHKGVHVLLAAWARLEPELRERAELHVRGDSTDRVYVEACRSEAERLGVHWHGAFDQPELPGILAGLDLMVVPSIWYENYPIAIREALAAGRPVVASDFGAIPESVEDGVDGRHFAVGDADDLARVLGELIREPQRVVSLRNGAKPVLGLREHVQQHLELYARVRARAEGEGASAEPVLPHLRQVAERYAALEALPNTELFRRALGGLDRLSELLGAKPESHGDLIARALGSRVRTQERLRDRSMERAYLRSELVAHAEAEAALKREADWRAEQAEGFAAAAKAVEAECAWLKGEVEALEAERDWRVTTERELQAKSAWLEGEVANRDLALQARADAIAEHERVAADLRHGISELERELGEREQELAELRSDLARIDSERVWREDEMREAVERLDSIRGRLIPGRFLLDEALTRWRESTRREPDASTNGEEASS